VGWEVRRSIWQTEGMSHEPTYLDASYLRKAAITLHICYANSSWSPPSTTRLWRQRKSYLLHQLHIGGLRTTIFLERSCLAVVFASRKLWHYMLAHSVKLIGKIDPLKYLLSKADLTGRLAKWVMLLSKYDIEYVEWKAIKGQIIADQLAETPLQGTTPMTFEFPDEDILSITTHSWKLYFDGSYTNHGLGAWILLVTPHSDTIPKSYRLLFPCTNNIVEYEALVIGLKMAAEWQIKELHVYGDSQLVINQVNDDY